MRNVFQLLVILLFCIVVSSCSGNRTKKAFVGTWEGSVEDEEIAVLSFMENDVFSYTTNEMGKTIMGTWTIDPNGNAVMDIEGETNKGIATFMNDEKIMLRDASESSGAVLEKSKSTSSKKAYKAFMGTWKGTYEEEPVELSFFMVKNILIWKWPGETIAGTWTIDHEGNARFTVDGEKYGATLVTEDKIVVQEEGDSEAALLEKSVSKKK